ncbi:unnamed protein product, partial [Prorocentrum cordatum]
AKDVVEVPDDSQKPLEGFDDSVDSHPGQCPGDGSPLRVTMSRMAQAMSKSFKHSFLAKVSEGIKSVSLGGEALLTYGSACSGSDLAFHAIESVLDTFLESWVPRSAEACKVKHVFACEKDQKKQKFLQAQFPQLECIFGDVSGLHSRTAKNMINDRRVPIPYVDLFAAGFSCKSRSNANNNSSSHKNCVQEGDLDTETGYTFHHIYRYILRSKPRLLFLENVSGLAEKDEGSSADGKEPKTQSDADWIVQQLEQNGYAARYVIFDASDFGSPAARKRIYFVAWLMEFDGLKDGSVRFDREKLGIVDRVMNNLTVEAISPKQCLILPPASLLPDSEHVTDFNCSSAKESRASESVWKEEHCNAFRGMEYPWPPEMPAKGVRDKGRKCTVQQDTVFSFYRMMLDDRNAELALFACSKFPMPPDSDPQFFDTKNSYSRTFAKDEDASPWRTVVPTLTGQGRMVVRYWYDGEVILRPVLGIECMAFAGWHFEWWEEPRCLYDDSLLINLAGNAFSAFAVVPIAMVLFHVQGAIWSVAQAVMSGEVPPAIDSQDDGDVSVGTSSSD